MATEELGVAGLEAFLGGHDEDGACHQRQLGEPVNAPCLPNTQAQPGILAWDLYHAAFSGEQT